jgi:hypothetical protein
MLLAELHETGKTLILNCSTRGIEKKAPGFPKGGSGAISFPGRFFGAGFVVTKELPKELFYLRRELFTALTYRS